MISKPVANPFVLNNAWRNGTMVYKAITATRLNIPNWFTESFRRCDKPKCRGSKIVVASGQTFRQIPAATTNNNGATGINIFQNNKTPMEG